MVQQISDAELEIMKIVWGNPEEMTLFPYIMDGLAARGKPCQKNTLIVLLSRLMNKGVSERQKDRTPQRIYHAHFGNGISDSADKKIPG